MMNQKAINPITTTMMAMLVLTWLIACEDAMILHDSSPSLDNQLTDADQQHIEIEDEKKIQIVEGRYIVVFEEQLGGQISQDAAEETTQRIQSIFSDFNLASDSLIHEYRYVSKGFAAFLSDEQAKALENDPRIRSIAQDIYYQAIRIETEPEADTLNAEQSSQSIPWGVQYVRGPLEKQFSNRAWVLDTGIDMTHNLLNVNANLSIAPVDYTNDPNDDSGHGTHVTGIIASKQGPNVVGVAPGAEVVAVKVCDNDGFCFVSDVLAGVNHTANNYNTGDVANMSLGWPTDLEGDPDFPWIDIPLNNLEDAIIDAANDGLMFTIAAGNFGRDANLESPARIDHNNVWTLSAVNSNDEFASFSNHGNPPIDYAAPGVNIYSLWSDGGTNTDSGTSQAAPHVAGILLGCGESGLTAWGTALNDPSPPADSLARANTPFIPSNITHSVVQNQFNPDYYNPRLDWDPVDGAIEYDIRRKHWEGDWKHWATTTSTSYTDIMTNSKSLQAVSWQPQDYWVAYKVRAVNECGGGAFPLSPKYFKYDPDDFIPTAL